ncbi:MAG: ATP-dependent DNA helicase [Fermentimonas sp.]|jgi:exodeoxyribonuclease-5
MVNQFFIERISRNFLYSLTSDQEKALGKITDFLFSEDSNLLFVMKGYAGTGKSTLVGELVKTMRRFKMKTVLLAPTGRAAKVFSSYADSQAYTIHRKIYRQKKFSEDSYNFELLENKHRDTLFIVDESSMISNQSAEFSIFGSGRLLEDLVNYVYSGQRCRLLLLGDEAQLPPVKEDNSPALDKYELESMGLKVLEEKLTEIVRQDVESGILENATRIRSALETFKTHDYPKLRIEGYDDVKLISGVDLLGELSEAYVRDVMEETIIISRTNKRVNAYNMGVRNSVLYREEEISAGDILMITKNDYFWMQSYEEVDFLANGEFVEVVRVLGYQELYGFRFCKARLYHKEYDIEFEANINLDVLHSDSPGLTREQNRSLFQSVMEDYSYITQKRKRYQKIKEDPYFNALQMKYGYAVTCHKAQGGEWRNVFLDIGYINEAYLGDNFYRWLYTAITRATQKLFLINLPSEMVDLSK